MQQRFTLLVLALVLLAPGCASAGADRGQNPTGAAGERTARLYVFAAASLSESFKEIGQAFEAQHPGLSVVFNFAGSQQLAQQIIQGAPADVFASANWAQMQVVLEAGLITPGEERAFAGNRLVVIVPRHNPGGITTLEDLAKSAHLLVLAAKEVPAGQYSLDFLERASQDPAFGVAYKEGVLANVVSYEESVRVVLSKVALGEADAGIVYTSDVFGANASKITPIDIPDALNVIASYPIAPVASSANPDLARAFVASVLSETGQSILAKYGYLRPE